MHAAGMTHAMVVGASAGGGIATDFTLAHPDAVDRLVLVGPAISGLRYSQYFNARVIENVRHFQQGDIEGALRESWIFAPGHDAAVSQAAALLKANPQDLMHGDMARLAPTAKPLLGSIKAPALILIGDHEMAEPQADEVRQELPQLLQAVKELGRLKSVTYEHGAEDGADVYLVVFEHGQAEWTIGPLAPDGKVQSRRFRLI
jgi:pimeloyl-ACP methyl ester carboxylesterase